MLPAEPIIFKDNKVFAAVPNGVATQVVKLNSQNSLTIKDAQLLMQDQGRVLAFTVEIVNKGKTALSLNDYWMKLKNKSGQSFSVKLIDGDKTKKAVLASSTQTLTYYAVVDNNSKLSDYIFESIVWDFSASNYERKLGSIQYPAGATNITNIGSKDNFIFSSTSLDASITDFVITEDQSNVYLTLNYIIENKGISAIDLAAVNLFVQTSDNKSYAMNTDSLKESKLRAGEKKTTTLRTILPKQIMGKNVTLVTTSYDESSKIYIPMSTINIGNVVKAKIVPKGSANVITLNGQRINTFIDSTIISGVTNKKEINIEYALRNVGTETIANPSLSFYLLTADNTYYPLTSNVTQTELSLLPKLREALTLTGTLPSSLNTKNAKLIVKTNDASTKSEYVLAAHELNISEQNAAVGVDFAYNNYAIKLNSIQSSTSENSDLLIAELSVSNKGKSSLSIPSFNGYFLINGVKLNVETKNVVLDNKLTLDVGDTYQFVVYAKVPYNTNINTASFVLTEKGSEPQSAEKTITRFTTNKLSPIAKQSTDKAYEILNPGSLTAAQLLKANLYTGTTGRYFYTEFELSNKESRSASLSALGGYVLDANGEAAFLNFSNYSKRVLSNGKVLVSGWTELSDSFDESNFDFIIGRSITVVNEGSEQSGETLIVKPISYSVDIGAEIKPRTELLKLPFAGYELSMRNIYATFSVLGPNNVNGIKLDFDYDLEKNKRYTAVATDNKIMVEFVDQGTGKIAYTKEISLGSGSGESGETVLKEAINGTTSIVFEDENFQLKIQKYENYVINVYDVFQDAKILIATKELKWFTIQ